MDQCELAIAGIVSHCIHASFATHSRPLYDISLPGFECDFLSERLVLEGALLGDATSLECHSQTTLTRAHAQAIVGRMLRRLLGCVSFLPSSLGVEEWKTSNTEGKGGIPKNDGGWGGRWPVKMGLLFFWIFLFYSNFWSNLANFMAS